MSGVGALTALAFVLTIADGTRFAKSRDIGAYLGLVPRQDGDRSSQLRITKAGDPYLRRLLVGSAQYIVGPFGPDTDLRRYGERLMQRGGKNGKKRAIVAGLSLTRFGGQVVKTLVPSVRPSVFILFRSSRSAVGTVEPQFHSIHSTSGIDVRGTVRSARLP